MPASHSAHTPGIARTLMTSDNTPPAIPTGNQLTSIITKNVSAASASMTAVEPPTTTH